LFLIITGILFLDNAAGNDFQSEIFFASNDKAVKDFGID
jgi:hypothetical protein